MIMSLGQNERQAFLMMQTIIINGHLFYQLFFRKSYIIIQGELERRMGIMHRVKNLVKMTDFFYSSEMLRYEDELQYRTLTGGVLSLGIIITILIGFASMIIDTINLSSITTQMQVVKSTNPSAAVLSTAPDSKFMFGVQIWRLNLTTQQRYFDITFRLMPQSGGQILNQTFFPLERCTKDHWAEYPQVLQNYEKLQISGWLCPQINSSFTIFGKYSSQEYNQFIIQVQGCKNETDPDHPCHSPESIDELFITRESFFYLTFYYINPVINSDEKDYKSYYLEDQSYVIFGDSLGSETFIYFTDYTIITDYSIWPFQNYVEDKGCIVQNLAVNHPFQAKKDGIYVTLNIVKSANSLIYRREVQKISSVFSFMGGMVGAASAVLFIIKVYTSLSFEISIALQVFKPQQGIEIQQEHTNINFLTFLKYEAFKFAKSIGRSFDWPSMSYIQQCQNEILRQLDVRAIIKRLIFIQHCLTYIFQDYQLDGLQLKKPTSARQIRKIRQKCESVFMDERRSSERGDPQSSSNSDQKKGEEQMRQEIVTKALQTNINSSNGLVSLNSPNISNILITSKTQKNLPQRRHGFIYDEPAPKMSKAKRQTVVIDYIVQRNDDLIEPSRESPTRAKAKQSSKISPARASYLKYLCSNAQEGNQISKKIWQNLSEDLKDQVMMESSSEQFN